MPESVDVGSRHYHFLETHWPAAVPGWPRGTVRQAEATLADYTQRGKFNETQSQPCWCDHEGKLPRCSGTSIASGKLRI